MKLYETAGELSQAEQREPQTDPPPQAPPKMTAFSIW